MIYLKYFLFFIITYMLIIISSYFTFFQEMKNNVIKEQNKLTKLEFNDFKNTIEDYILNNQINKIDSYQVKINEKNLFEYINMNYINYFITHTSILLKSNKYITAQWYLNDVSIDDKYGKITQIDALTYNIKPKNKILLNNNIEIKSQATDQNIIKNIISTFNFNIKNYKNTNNTNYNNLKLLKSYLFIENKEEIYYLYINDIYKYAKITYKKNINITYQKIQDVIFKYLKFVLILLVILMLIIFIFNYFIIQVNINKTIKKLNKYIQDIINNNFYKFDSSNIAFEDVKIISNNITLLSNKIASLSNELNVNKNLLESKVTSDQLTNLPNSKMFYNDIKNLFLFKDDAYIIKIKLDVLKSFSKKNTESKINIFILAFVKQIKNIIKNNNNIKLYRFYGSEFIMIYKYASKEDIEILFNALKNEFEELKELFTIEKKLSHIIAFNFDKYSSTDEIIEKAESLYNSTRMKNEYFSFAIEENKELTNNHNKLDNIVSSIIKTNSFTISYKFDTYSYEDNKLIMQEVSAKLLNYDGSYIPIGTFISVAQDNNLAIKFDKKLILKTFEYIKNNNINHILAVNISIDSLKSKDFILWMESMLLFEYKDYTKYLIFSITSFTAKNYFDYFIDFSKQIKKFNGMILLKRFSYDDYTQEQLDVIDVDYIRVDKYYTNDIDKHKKSILKNIKVYSLNKDIITLADTVKDTYDNNNLKSLGFYGTSK